MHFTKEPLYENQRIIRAALNPVEGIRAHLREKGAAEVTLDVAALQGLPVRILGLKIGNELIKPYLNEVILLGRKPHILPDFKELRFIIPPNMRDNENLLDEVNLSYSILGTSLEREAEIIPWTSETGQAVPSIVRAGNIWSFPFLFTDDFLKEVKVPPGTWVLREDLIVPKDYTFVVMAGADISLLNKAMILSYGPVKFLGTETAPAVLRSPDESGYGLVVIGAEAESLIEYARFENLSPPLRNGWALTGSITFYESPIKIRQSYFAKNIGGDDLVNIIRSNFSISNSVFRESLVDALDGDFITGTITNTRFIESGGDAVDVSGSKVTLDGVHIEGALDKGISVGEESSLEAFNTFITKAFIGIASKDGSQVSGKNITIKDTDIGLAAYQKKPEYGPASLSLVELVLDEVKTKALSETNSSITIDGEEMAEEDGVYGKLYGEDE